MMIIIRELMLHCIIFPIKKTTESIIAIHLKSDKNK